MTQMATGALTFLRGDVHAARETVARTYSKDQVLDSRRLPRTEQPYFTPGFPLAMPLQHGVRIQSLDGAPTAKFGSTDEVPIVSDTRELAWYTSAQKTGLVTVETDRTQALIGFVHANAKPLKNLSAEIANQFASIVLTSMDAKALSQSATMLLTAGSRVTNTGLKWNDAHTGTTNQGESPSLIEPVTGTVVLRDIHKAKGIGMFALDGAGHPIGEPIPAKKTEAGWELPIGTPVTTWYVISVKR
jgi:hypothetical protein